jgi:divinyl protochlorophyllide a 8-vinyl-reductase
MSPAAGTHAHQADRIGPNAVTRLGAAITATEGAQATARVFRACNLETYLVAPPVEMVDARAVADLHRELHKAFGDARARLIGRAAGRETAEYLLRHRIPRVAQFVLRHLASRHASARLLVAAISKNAWTFAGSGEFRACGRRPLVFSIRGCPLCRSAASTSPYCDFYAGTFERLFRLLVDAHASVDEIACQATGHTACQFSIEW